LPFNSGPISGPVNALAVYGSTVFVGGQFSSLGGQTHNNLAALDATTGAAMPWSAEANGIVSALLLDGSTLYVGGHFTGIRGFTMAGGQPRLRIAGIDAGSGLATSWRPEAGDRVQAMLVSGSQMLIGGLFSSAGGKARANLAAFDVTTGAVTSWDPGTDGDVR